MDFTLSGDQEDARGQLSCGICLHFGKSVNQKHDGAAEDFRPSTDQEGIGTELQLPIRGL
jgi:hypothetical protein